MVRKKVEVPPPPAVQAVKPADQEGAEPAEPTSTAMVRKTVEAAPQPPGAEAPEVPPEAKPAPPEEPERKLAYVYDPKGKINPFQSVFVTQPRGRRGTKVQIAARERKLPLTPLQKIDLSQLKIVGIMVIPTGNKALVEDPSGKGYVITKGTYVGANFGRVKRILKDRIIVEEEVEDFFSGQMKLQTTELRIQKRLDLEASEGTRGR
jgi:type IV pilus assembly protein PilP